MFRDRVDAGQQLAAAVKSQVRPLPDLVLGIPRGGVPVAAEIAAALGVPLDVLVVRKLGHPGNPEYAIGAIAGGGILILHRQAGIAERDLAGILLREREELRRRETRFRGQRSPQSVAGRSVLLVDDGLATGATMQAAIAALRMQHARQVSVAVPVAPRDVCRRLRMEVAEFVCLLEPETFSAVGDFYHDFAATSDTEVVRLLEQSQSSCVPDHGTDSEAGGTDSVSG